jgi:hypothetical protein
MKEIAFIASFFLTCFIANGQDVSNTTYSEPPTIFQLTINDKVYPLCEGENLRLDTTISKPTISIKTENYKQFNIQAISLRYPKNLSFQFEQDYGYKNWTLTGNTLTILIFEIDSKTELSELLNNMVKKFGKKNCAIEDFQKPLGHTMCNGKKLSVLIADQHLVLDCYEIKLNDFKSRFIYFQDTLKDGKHSEEFENGFTLINSSFVVK